MTGSVIPITQLYDYLFQDNRNGEIACVICFFLSIQKIVAQIDVRFARRFADGTLNNGAVISPIYFYKGLCRNS